MKNFKMNRTTNQHRRMPGFAITLMAAALFVMTPFHAALAVTAPVLGTADSFAVLGNTAVTLTNAAIVGDVGSPTAVTVTSSTVMGTVYPVGDPIVIAAYTDFLAAYAAMAPGASPEQYPCPVTDNLDTAYGITAVSFEPGIYCNSAAVTFTGTPVTLTNLNNDPNPVWIFKIGTGGTGALTGINLTVAMADGTQPCNVYWWTAEAVTMTDSNLKGTVLAGAATTTTRGSLIGRFLAQAAVTMSGTDVFGCDSLPPPNGSNICHRRHSHDDNKGHNKDHDRCNQGVGNGAEGCDPGKSNHGDDSHSNDEEGGTHSHPGRKGHKGHDDE
jgi:hypothetical protein